MTKNLLNRNYKVFVDFDGTITKQDVGEHMFLKFGDAEEARNIIEKWFKNENDSVFTKLSASTLKQIEAYSEIFKERVNAFDNGTVEKTLKNQLLLIETMLRFKENMKQFNTIDFDNLKKAVSDIHSRYPEKYDANSFMVRLEQAAVDYKRVEKLLLSF